MIRIDGYRVGIRWGKVKSAVGIAGPCVLIPVVWYAFGWVTLSLMNEPIVYYVVGDRSVGDPHGLFGTMLIGFVVFVAVVVVLCVAAVVGAELLIIERIDDDPQAGAEVSD